MVEREVRAQRAAAIAAPERLDRRTKLFYGFGSVSFGVEDNGLSYLLLLFYNQVVGLAAPLVGLARRPWSATSARSSAPSSSACRDVRSP